MDLEDREEARGSGVASWSGATTRDPEQCGRLGRREREQAEEVARQELRSSHPGPRP